MSRSLIHKVKKFFKHTSLQAPFLLALSGGGDSACLWHLLRICQIPHHIAHVDHGWREQSAEEASQLHLQAKTLNVPFHLKTLQMSDFQGNLEEQGRLARLSFFRSICKQEHLSGVLMAHHADDVAETVLKRLFESAPIEKLGGIKEMVTIENMWVLRPLLSISKKEILEYNTRNQIAYFEDSTNADPRFLRARLRKNLIPHLSSCFGKQVSGSLSSIAKESFELRDYLEDQLMFFEHLIENRGAELVLNLKHQVLHPYMLRQLIKKFFSHLKLPQNRSVVNACLEAISSGHLHWKIELAGRVIRVHERDLSVDLVVGV